MRDYILAGLIAAVTVSVAGAQPPTTTLPSEDLFIQELIRRSKQTDRLLATSIRDALRLKLDDLANQFLASLAGRKLAPEATVPLTREISAERLLRVLVEPQFSDAAKNQASMMLEALQATEQDITILAPAIKKLHSSSAEEQLSALRTVLAGGNQSIVLLSVAAATETNSAARDQILRVLLRLGDGGPAAIRQLAIYGADSIRAGALRALIRLGTDLARPVVAAAAHDPRSTDDERSVANDWLSSLYRGVPSRADAEVYLMDRLAYQREVVEQLRRADSEATDGTIDLWTVGENQASVTPTKVTFLDAAMHDVIDHARLLHRLGQLSPEAVRAGVSAELAYRYHLDPLMASEAGEDIASLWGEESVSPIAIAELIEDSVALGDLLVAVAAIELIPPAANEKAELLMTTHSPTPTALVTATMHPEPRLRYHAGAAIGRLGFTSGYAGSSEVLRCWLEMVRLTREPIVLIVGTRLEVDGQIERVLTSIGYRIETVNTAEDAVLAIDRGGDLRFVISTTVLPDRSSLELIDAIRRRPLGATVPIVLHGPVDGAVEMAITDKRWAAPVVHTELPASASGWSLVLEPLDRSRPLLPLSAVERFDFRAAGADSLGRIASQPDHFVFYELGKLAGADVTGATVQGESPSVAFGESHLALLSVTASQYAQSALADLTVRREVPVARREAAADALLFSIERNGVLLAGDDLLRLTHIRQTVDNETGKTIDRVLAEIGRRADVGGLTSDPIDQSELPQQTEKRVSPPDI
jgi:hypothetical protein